MITPLAQLQSMLHVEYTSIDGDQFQVALFEPFTQEEITALAKLFPQQQLPGELRELLAFARGFDFWGIEEISFSTIAKDYDELFPFALQLAGDDLGNFWLLDINKDGKLGCVFFVCHDPGVVIKQANDLTEFIFQVHEFGQKMQHSTLNTVQEIVVYNVWTEHNSLLDHAMAKDSNDVALREFAAQLPEHFSIGDLRGKPNQAGFAFGHAEEDPIRHETLYLWGIERKERKGFLQKIFHL
ncbi:SMI1/KNR4 family protein SUKH-1 [Chitinophaga skermanii]|uniref:SMI1/KNR4 family protein SUKH-1 n=1 Tax=Chitinophaga skermanii TaxID=331697 RepID=A0A327QMW2_9BACT|nr:SMI1/KNR4 family protein [Chitinophaga skermanii]RAJ05034.1 SMI1/KNR4 family protein SUKH-1 [Chitinophaga skermanii]